MEGLLKQAEETVSSNYIPGFFVNANKCFWQYKKHHLEMYGNSAPTPHQRTGKSATRKLGILIRELSDDEDDTESPASPIVPEDLRAPWQKDFNGYLNSKDQLGNMTITEWWGVSITHFLYCDDYNLIVKIVECHSVSCLGFSCA